MSGTLLQKDMSELRRVQLAHEGMRMLLCSELKQAEDLFKASRYVAAGIASLIKKAAVLFLFGW